MESKLKKKIPWNHLFKSVARLKLQGVMNSKYCGSYIHGHLTGYYEGWNFNSGNYLFTTDTK